MSQRAGAAEYVTNYERNFDIPKQIFFLFEPWAKDERRMSELWAKDKPTNLNPPLSTKTSKKQYIFLFYSKNAEKKQFSSLSPVFLQFLCIKPNRHPQYNNIDFQQITIIPQ